MTGSPHGRAQPAAQGDFAYDRLSRSRRPQRDVLRFRRFLGPCDVGQGAHIGLSLGSVENVDLKSKIRGGLPPRGHWMERSVAATLQRINSVIAVPLRQTIYC